MTTSTPRHASWLAILFVLIMALAACTAPEGGGASGAPATDAPAGSGEPAPTTDDYGY